MRTTYAIEPAGWPCTLAACPPGPFMNGDDLCMKTEYGECEAYLSSGERFWGGTSTIQELSKVIVQPVVMVKKEIEE